MYMRIIFLIAVVYVATVDARRSISERDLSESSMMSQLRMMNSKKGGMQMTSKKGGKKSGKKSGKKNKSKITREPYPSAPSPVSAPAVPDTPAPVSQTLPAPVSQIVPAPGLPTAVASSAPSGSTLPSSIPSDVPSPSPSGSAWPSNIPSDFPSLVDLSTMV
jgi:hypothetical protein